MDDHIYRAPQSELELDGTKSPSSEGYGEFDFARAFNLGWEAFSRNMGIGIGVTLLYFVLIIPAVLTCVGIILALPHLMAAFPMMGLFMVRRQLVTDDLFVGFKAYGRVLGVVLITGFIGSIIALAFSAPLYAVMFAGDLAGMMQDPEKLLKAMVNPANPFLTLISYGSMPITMYLSARWTLNMPLIIERRQGPFAALGKSWKATAHCHGMLFLFFVVFTLINMAGLLACCIPVLFTMPLSMALQGAAIHMLLGEDRPKGSSDSSSAPDSGDAGIDQSDFNSPPSSGSRYTPQSGNDTY